MYIESHSELQLVPKLLLQVSIKELNNIIVIPPEEDIITEKRYAYNNIVIIDYMLQNILPPQLKKMSA